MRSTYIKFPRTSSLKSPYFPSLSARIHDLYHLRRSKESAICGRAPIEDGADEPTPTLGTGSVSDVLGRCQAAGARSSVRGSGAAFRVAPLGRGLPRAIHRILARARQSV